MDELVRKKPTASFLGLVLVLVMTAFIQEAPIPQEQEAGQETQREPVIPMEKGKLLTVLEFLETPPPPGLLPLRKVVELQPTGYAKPPALFHEGVLVVASRDGVVDGYDEETGEFLWKLGFPDKEFLPPCATTYGLLLSTRDGTLLEVDTSTGAVTEESSTPISLALAPLLTDESYLLASPEGEIVALDLWTKQQLWIADTEEPPAALAVGGDLLVVSGAGGTLTAIEVGSGRLRWKHRGRGGFLAPAVFDAKAERLYIGDEAGDFYSLSVDKGKTHYRWSFGAAIVHPVLIEGDDLYLVSYANTLVAYRTRNGHELWRVNLPGRPASLPVRINQRIVVATMDGFIVEVNPIRGRRAGAPFKAPGPLRGNAGFYPPYTALTLITGNILLLETAPPELPPLTEPEEEAETGEEEPATTGPPSKRPPKKGPPKKGPAK
jgi:outer membrane protein assembly factor BamB